MSKTDWKYLYNRSLDDTKQAYQKVSSQRTEILELNHKLRLARTQTVFLLVIILGLFITR